MQKHILTLTLGCIGLFAPLVVAAHTVAGTPSPIHTLEAKQEGDGIIVVWEKASDPKGIRGYKIYFSARSILENDGDYDDMEEVMGDTTTFRFPAAPINGAEIYFAVLAVNNEGIESPGFEVETKMTYEKMTAPPPPASSSSSSVISSVSSSAQPSLSITSEASSNSVSSEVVSSSSSLSLPYVRNPMLEANVTTPDTETSDHSDALPLANTGMETWIVGTLALLGSWVVVRKRRAVN